jgi:prolipoprotein diacylglyceryltransferase
MKSHRKRTLFFSPEFHALNRAWSAYQVFNILGLLLGALLGSLLAGQLGLSPWVILTLSLVGFLSITGLGLVSRVLTGEEHLLNNYRVQVLFLLLCGGMVAALRRPVLPYLDLAAIGAAAMMVPGRVGCLHASCCHGRPARWGVCYGAAHVKEGLEAYLAGVRLFPVQVLASLWALVITGLGTLVVLGGAAPGTAFGWHVAAYGVGRFAQEFLRGDAGRAHWRGFSEAQWTALATIWALVGAGALGWLPAYGWHVAAGVGLGLVMLGVAVRWRLQKALRQDIARHKLLHVEHIHEVARGLHSLARRPVKAGAVGVVTTSLGIQISAGEVAQEAGPPLRHYTLSHRDVPLTEAAAALLGDLIAKLRHPGARPQVVKGQQDGVFHALVC